MRIADLWAAFHPDGRPDVESGMSFVEEGERIALCSYLDSAAVVIPSSRVVRDEIDDERSGIPVTWFTDGEWIWSAQLSHYLATYGLICESDLLDHIRGRGYQPASVGDETRERALAVLMGPT